MIVTREGSHRISRIVFKPHNNRNATEGCTDYRLRTAIKKFRGFGERILVDWRWREGKNEYVRSQSEPTEQLMMSLAARLPTFEEDCRDLIQKIIYLGIIPSPGDRIILSGRWFPATITESKLELGGTHQGVPVRK